MRRAARKRHEIGRRTKDRLGRLWRLTLEAFTTTIAILIIALFAAGAALAALLFAAPQLVANGQWLAIGAACALSGILAAVFYSVRREAEAANWTRLERTLETRATPDSGYYTHRLEIRKAGKERDFLDQFAHIPADSREAMLVLRQNASRNPRESGYEAESIRDQVMKADSHLDRLVSPRIAWLCLTDRKGRFVAYESYDAFRTQALRSGVRGYADVLNVRDTEEFNTRIGVHIGSDFSAHVLQEGVSKREALAQMMAQGWDHAMIVSRGDRKPVGIATLRGLIAEIFPNEQGAAKIEPVVESVSDNPAGPAEAPETASATAHEEVVVPAQTHQSEPSPHEEPSSPLATLIAPAQEHADHAIANVISEPVAQEQAPQPHAEEHAA
ncbi:MAG: hypothetical protein HY243_08535 [Proteobacteria bacterium]|nr:hypothetical protein [Pseudomonadota bacterium]